MVHMRSLLDRFIQAVCCGLFIVMVVAASWQVISRYALNSPSTISEAFLRFSLVWLSMIAIAYVAGRREHVSLTLLTDRLSGIWKATLDMSIEILFIAFAGLVMIYGGAQAASNTMSQIYPMLEIPKGFLYLSLPASGSIIVTYCLMNCLDLFHACHLSRSQ
ncbi:MULTISPECIES: TRAP transporter small permease [Halomonas]|uniref:TRAP transporter small permease protein n=1 Tax=Halomonas halophila TaxID=29573 RepID=A0ABQ0U4I5_9GAMM|nr:MULTISPECIES: TRAP transporter small permease [Halomonas]MDR5890517.1 TRAP transporter small permease [Halomonas salina]WJY08283.1 TRAP transporter small permease [Halomonas halophila]GEK72643.1 ATP-independent transporter subunit [Halomonas halophila]